MLRCFLVAIVLVTLCFLSHPGKSAESTILCLPRADFAAALADFYDQQVVAWGRDSEGSLVEVYASPEGTWTMTLTIVGFDSCAVFRGEGWRSVHPRKKPA